MPMDEVTVYYNATGSLTRVIPEYSDFIFATIKQPLSRFPVPSTGIEVIIKEDAKVWLHCAVCFMSFACLSVMF